MPVLGKETSQFPEDLLKDWFRESVDRQWWVLYTKARQEKAMGRYLLAWKIPFYLPLVPRTFLYRGREMRSHNPLFPGYVFLFASPEERYRALTTNLISQVLEVPDQQTLFKDLQNIERLIASGAPLTVESRLLPGKRVRVCQGALEGLEGTVVKRRARTALVVRVNFIQQGASIEIEDALLDPVD